MHGIGHWLQAHCALRSDPTGEHAAAHYTTVQGRASTGILPGCDVEVETTAQGRYVC